MLMWLIATAIVLFAVYIVLPHYKIELPMASVPYVQYMWIALAVVPVVNVITAAYLLGYGFFTYAQRNGANGFGPK